MVVQDSFEVETSEVAVVKSKLASEKYVVVKNHVREIKSIESKNENQNKDVDHGTKQTIQKKKPLKHKLSNCTEFDTQNSKDCVISKNDLEELKTVYFQCKRVIENIEIKYGHLLNFSNEEACNSFSESFQDEEKCNCDQNKKIIFNENGEQTVKEAAEEKHICLKKLQCKQSNLLPEHTNLQIEYENESLYQEAKDLPNSLIELDNMLKEPRIELKHRRRIINKIKSLRLDYMNEIRCNKKMLVKQLRVNPDEMLKFEGTNLSTLSGYCT